MALGNTGISTAVIKNAIGESSNVLRVLCRSDRVNRYSKHKPVSGVWPKSSNNQYALSVPAFVWGSHQDWTYAKPSSEYREGDFRKYEHAALPPIGLKAGSFTTEYNIRASDGAIMPHITWIDAVSDYYLTLKDFYLEGYYLGIEIRSTTGAKLKWTGQGNKNGASDFVALPWRTNSIFNQSQWIGNISFQLFLSDTQIGIGDPDLVVNRKALPTCTVNGVSYVDSGVFNIKDSATFSCQILAIKGDTYGGTSGFSSVLEEFIQSPGSITLKVQIKSPAGTVDYSNMDIEVSPTYGDDKYSYYNIGGSNGIVYDSNNSSKVAFTATTTWKTYYIRLSNCLNRKNGGVYMAEPGESTAAGVMLVESGHKTGIGVITASVTGGGFDPGEL